MLDRTLRSMLRDFVLANRDEVLARARRRVAQRSAPLATEIELTHGLPAFLDELAEALRKASAAEIFDSAVLERGATHHGHDLFVRGVTVAQVVHDYGDLCQVITGLADEQHADIAPREFQTLNLCLDDAIAGAVTAYAHEREQAIADASTERLGMLAHELRNALNGATPLLRDREERGGRAGRSDERHGGSLPQEAEHAHRSLARRGPPRGGRSKPRAGTHLRDLRRGRDRRRRRRARAPPRPRGLGGRRIAERRRRFGRLLTAAVGNLVQNALKFTHPGTTVRLRAHTARDRVLIDVEDECGGLPTEMHANLLRPFVQAGANRTGLGLGLSICTKAMRTMGGEMRIRDLPGKGCVFTLDLPRQPAPPIPLRRHANPGAQERGGAAGGDDAPRTRKAK